MPQMAPLLWAPLFLLFSALLMVAMVKISFSSKIYHSNNSIMIDSGLMKCKMWKW